MIKELRSRLFAVFTLVVMVIFSIYSAIALVPLAPETVTRGLDTTQNASNNNIRNATAYAGNITELNFTVSSQTKHWQGYYGYITGTIVLDDADDYTLYDWPNAEPKGEIYATPNRTTPVWADMICFNHTMNTSHIGNYSQPEQWLTSGGYGGLGTTYEWERAFNFTHNDVDGINETFDQTDEHAIFDIGDVNTIGEGAENCMHTYMHMNDSFQTDKFLEVLLQDSAGSIVFAAILENDDTANNTDIQGFKGDPFTPDFQMMVPEDGTSRTGGGEINTDTTLYWFYLDLE